MRLYSGSSKEFIELNKRNKLAEFLKQAFFQSLGYNPSQNEVMSWRNSLFRMAVLIEEYKLDDHGIMVEYQLPMNSKRIDVIICGLNDQMKKHSVVIELKQWERCEFNDYDSDRVLTWVGGGHRSVLHPSIQVGNYMYYLEFNQTAFYNESDPISLSACSYLHNYGYDITDPLYDKRFEHATSKFPIFTSDDYDKLGDYLFTSLSNGQGMSIVEHIEKSKHQPSKKLLAHVSSVIKDKLLKKELAVVGRMDDYVLLDEQLIVFDAVMSIVKMNSHLTQKHVLIVKGGPGTGKSVIALKLLADLSAKNISANYATGSKSFTETLRKIIRIHGGAYFKYFSSFGQGEENELDVLILDEAHRIRSKTGYPMKSTGRSQIVDLMRAARITVLFIDEFQAVRKDEIGSISYFKSEAEKYGCKILEFELEAQFRCGGSDGYINWITNTLQIERTANSLWKNTKDFDFHILSSPEEVEIEIRKRFSEGFSARMTAGFCWPWSKELDTVGSLKNDIEIGTFKRPWNAFPELRNLPRTIPTSNYWAYDPNGINQVGCVYTAQGFEFDYIGVIIGKDIKFDFEKGEWIANPKESFDTSVKSAKDPLQLIKNVYRILMTRGMKGCYVCFLDKDTENFFKSRLER